MRTGSPATGAVYHSQLLALRALLPSSATFCQRVIGGWAAALESCPRYSSDPRLVYCGIFLRV